jgi:hypothetical protein
MARAAVVERLVEVIASLRCQARPVLWVKPWRRESLRFMTFTETFPPGKAVLAEPRVVSADLVCGRR